MGRYRKNVKRIDPRYFLDETANRDAEGAPLEESGDPSVARMLWDLFTKPSAAQRELDPVHSERALDRERDAEEAASDMEHRKLNPVTDEPETYGRPHALKTRTPVTEAQDPTPPALSQWVGLFPRAAEALYEALRAMGGEEIPGLVKHTRTSSDRAEAKAELASAKKERGPRFPNTWGKFEEGK